MIINILKINKKNIYLWSFKLSKFNFFTVIKEIKNILYNSNTKTLNNGSILNFGKLNPLSAHNYKLLKQKNIFV